MRVTPSKPILKKTEYSVKCFGRDSIYEVAESCANCNFMISKISKSIFIVRDALSIKRSQYGLTKKCYKLSFSYMGRNERRFSRRILRKNIETIISAAVEEVEAKKSVNFDQVIASIRYF